MTAVKEYGAAGEEEEEGVEALEAEHVYILMKKEYRISRNVRAEWYLRRINSIISFPKREKLRENEEELEVVSVIPVDIPQEWDYDTSHLYKYRITQGTTLHFLSRKYRLVFCLDLSPSTSVVDVTKGSVVLDEVFATLRQCLKGIVRPFYVPGSQLLFQPEVYLTIIAHTPFFKSQSQQVLVQGWLLMVHNLDEFLDSIHIKLTKLEAQLAEATAQTYGQMDITREKCDLVQERMTEEAIFLGPTTLTNPMVSPDIGFVDMLRYGIVALQLLPENSSAGIVVITDGVISLPDATVFDSLLVQLRNQTIACSFLQLGSVYHPQASLGYVPFSDLMSFLATATCGAYLPTLPPIGDDYDYDMNNYHKSLLSWGFQKFMYGLCPDNDNDHDGMNGFYSLLPVAQEATELMRKKERENQLNTALNAVLSCRLREGYAIKQVTIADDQIQLVLVLPWKYSIFIEYHIRSVWPPTQSFVNTEVWIEATYEFLNDVTSDVHRQFRSKYRQSMVAKYWSTLQHLRDTDMLLVGLQSFATNPLYFTIPDCIKRGHPVFYRNSGHINSISDATSDQFPQFTTFWKPVCMLDTNIWQKWMHTHRIGILLEHDHPLPKNLHITNTSGRYGIVHCRQAESALTALLAEWCDFILIENDSYVKFFYREGDKEKTPVSFFVVRITSKPPPCLVIRLAFLGGTPGHIRNQLVSHIREKIQGLTFPSRMGLTERSKSLPPAIHQTQDKMGEDMSISASSDLRPTGVRPVLARVASNIPCCVITHKPVEKILIWYDKMPSNLLSIVPETPISSSTKSIYLKLGTTKSATHNMALLSRYLHHRRWIWAVQAPSAPSVSLNAVARILNTLSRIRLQEGFNFAYSCNGIITMVREFDMKLELTESEGKGVLESCGESGLATFPCVAQYVIFPPHISNSSRDSIVDEDWEEGDSVEADGEMQIVTECWVEPQNGVVTSPSPHALHLHNCNYRQLAQAFFPVDEKCIWGLLTVEHLLLMCQGGGSGGGIEASGLVDAHQPAEVNGDPALRITQVPFSFDVIRLLPMCQQVELLVSTYIQDLFSSLVKRVTFGCETSVDEANQILYSLLLDHLCQLHHNREFQLSPSDMAALPHVLQQRNRPPTAKSSPFSNTYINKTSDPPKWRCFLKGISSNHLLITLLPASYSDLKLLLVKRANITETRNMALKLVPNSSSFLDLDTETNTTDQPPAGPMSEQQISLESSTSSLTHMTSPSLPPPTPTNSRYATVSVDEVGDHAPSRIRYKSGPISQTNSHSVQPVFSDSLLRERASSFHVSRERCSSFGQGAGGAERNRTGSVDSPTKEPQNDVPKITSPNEHVRKRYISMPSKSYSGIYDPISTIISAESLRNEDSCVPLHLQAVGDAGETDSVRRVSSLDESTSAVNPSPAYKPLFGAVTLPIYVYDCKLSSITTQLINCDNRCSVVGKDVYVDATSKLESEIVEDTVPLKDDSTPSATSLQEDPKQPSPEPRSEESDVGDSSCLRAHVEALEVLYLRSFVLGVFQALQRELTINAHDMQVALDLCHESVMEIEITNFLQTICGHLRDFRLRMDLEHIHQRWPEPSVPETDPPDQGTTTGKQAKQESSANSSDMAGQRSSSGMSSNRFPLSLLKLHHPCRDLQQLHSSIRERFLTILQGSFHPVPSLPDYYFFSPQTFRRSSEGTPVGDFIYVSSRELEQWEKDQLDLTRHRKLRRVSVSKKSDVFTEGEEELDDENTVNGGEEEDEDEDHDKSIEFRSEIGSTVYHRLHSQLTAFEGDEDKTSVISERDEDLSTLPDNMDLADGPIPPLFLHFTCTVRLAGHVQSTLSMKTVPTCLNEIVDSLRGNDVDLSSVNVTLDVLCMTLPPALASKTAGESVASMMDSRSARTTSFCSMASPQQKRTRSISESTCASLSDMDESYMEDEDQLGHLPNYQHQAIVSTVDEIKWLLRDEIASAMLQVYPLAEQTLNMVATHVESSRQARNCISESIPLNFVCGMEQSRDKFMQEFGRLSVSGHHLKQEGSLYYVVQDKTQMRRRHFSTLVPPLGLKNQFLIVRPQPHADDTAQLRQMDSGCLANKVSLSSPDALTSPPARLQATRVSFDTERHFPECSGDVENSNQRAEGSEKEKWVRRRERKERRDSERRGSINTSDSDNDIKQVRSSFSRESSHQSHEGKLRSSESPKKSLTPSATLAIAKYEGCDAEEEEDDEDKEDEGISDNAKEYRGFSNSPPTSIGHVEEALPSVECIEEAPTSAGDVEEALTSVEGVKEAPISVGSVKEATTSVGRDEEPPTSVGRDKPPTSVGCDEELPTSVECVEEPPTSMSHAEEAPTTVGHAEEAPTSVGHTEEAPTSVGHAEEAPTSVGLAEETPTSMSHAEEAPTIVGHAEEAPTPVGHAEEAPTPVGHAEEAPTPVGHAEEAPTSVGHAEEAPTPVGHAEEAPTPVGHAEEAPTPVGHAEEAPTPVGHAEEGPTFAVCFEEPRASVGRVEELPASVGHAEEPPASVGHAEEPSVSVGHAEEPVMSVKHVEEPQMFVGCFDDPPTCVAPVEKRADVENLELLGEISKKMHDLLSPKSIDDYGNKDTQFFVKNTSSDSSCITTEDKPIESKDKCQNQIADISALSEILSSNPERKEKTNQGCDNISQTLRFCGETESVESYRTETFIPKDGKLEDVDTDSASRVLTLVEGASTLLEMQKPMKDTGHRLSLPLNELIRCGSESLPRPSVSAEVIRKSASTDNFTPCSTEASVEQLKSAPSCAMNSGGSCGLWAEFIKSRHNSSELMKSRNNSGTNADLLKSRHNSGTGGDILKSRHNSGTGSVPGGPFSDVSSLLESGQTTEDGCEGDISDSDNDCCDWLQDFESVRPFLPEFWLILRVSIDRVDTFFHCRTESEMARWREIQTEVVRCVRSLVKLVNQTLLLQDLHNTRMCNHLLEPETSDDIWRHEDTKGRSVDDSDPEYRGYLEAAFKFKAGAFACRVVWETKFELHPKVKLCAGKVGSKGIQALRTILNPFSVNNRKNMFVYEDSSGNGSNVFYLRLKEHQSTTISPQVEGRRDETGLSRSSSAVSLGKRGTREDDPSNLKTVCTSQHYELRPRVSSFGEKDVIMEGVPSAPAQRKRNHYIILTVHGIAEPGPAIKEELVRMLQNRLDEAVVEAICLMLWSNPQHKLTPEDVHFIQPPYQSPKTVIRFTVNAHALPYLQAVGYYLRQNMLSCGFIHPKFADNCPEYHFQDFSATDQDLSSEPNIFLFVRPRKSAAKGIACIAFSVVDGSGCTVQYIGCPRPSKDAYQEIFTKQDFEALTHTQEYQPSPTKSPGPMAMLQFKVWESGRVDLDEVRRYLVDSTRHALWDVNTEYRLLTAPVTLSHPVQQYSSPASEPSTPKKETRGAAMRSVSLLETGTQPVEDRTRSVSVSGVPPHVCLPRMANKLGSKKMVHPSEGRGDNQRERASSPLTLLQARLRLMSNSVPDLKLRGCRTASQSPWDSSTASDGAPTSMGHSPLKVRHSVDLGVERNKLLAEDGNSTLLESQAWDYITSSCSTLHPIFHGLILDWLEYASELDEKGEHAVRKELGEKGGEHAVKKHAVHITTRHAVPIFITELQKWVSQHSNDTTTKIFEETMHESEEAPVYTLVDSSKVPQVVKADPKGGYVHSNFIIIGRNKHLWWASLFEENFNDYSLSMIMSSKNSQRYHPLVVSPRGRCMSGGEASFPRLESTGVSSGVTTPSVLPPPTTPLAVSVTGNAVSSAIAISNPMNVPSTPTSLSSAVGSLWQCEAADVLFIPRQKLLLATLRGLELVIYTYNWTKEHCDNLHSAMTRLGHWSTARNRLLSTIVLQKMGLYHNQPFMCKSADKKEEGNNPYIGNGAHVEGLIKFQSPIRELPANTDRGNRRVQGVLSVPSLNDVYRDSRPRRSLRNSQYGSLKDLELRHGTQMTEIRRHILQRETQRKVLLKTLVQTHGHSSPVFNDKILALYKQNARIVHFCYTPLLFLPRWRWQVAAARDHSLADPHSPADKTTTFGLKTPEPRSRHDSGSSAKGMGGSGPTDLRRSLSLKSNLPSPSQRRRHVTGGDEKWHDALCSSYLKEYIQYLQSLGFLTLNVTHAPQQRGRGIGREPESRSFRIKEVRFSEQVTKEPTYLLKNVLGGTILLEIIFLEPYFSAKIYVLESCRLEGKKLSSQIEPVSKVVVGGPLPTHSPAAPIYPEGCPPDQIDDKFAINSFLDKVDDIKVLLHMHSFTFDFHLRALCAYVADRQLLFTPGYHLSSCLSDFIKYYNKGPNFARNLIHSGKVTIADTGTPGEQLYNYLLAREKQYRMRVLRMTPVIHDPNALMQYTEFILVHTKTCRVHYKDANDQRVSDEYDVTLLVSHNTSGELHVGNMHPNILHLNFYVILTSTREMYPNRILEKKMGKFRTVSTAPSLGKRWTPSSTHPEGSDQSGSVTPPAGAEDELPKVSSATDDLPPPVKSYIGIRSESVNYLGYYTQYEETMQRTLEAQAEEARTRIHHIFNQAKIHCRRDSLWQRLTASLREDERQKLTREQILGGLSFSELSELLTLVSVEPLSSVDPQLLPLLSKPLQWYQGLTRVLQSKYQERHRSLTSSDGNIQHVVVLSSTCSDAFMMLSINLHYQKAELCCVNKQLKGEGGTQAFTDRRVQALIQDFVNACCFHLWCGLL
ncbi:KICSTOR complex protein SZT2 isoform X2 [Procambarus clarkii]|uniref:KICSTOR complex protein SZT2 isoform X2 n=1 Tax=Procambarus clarkii TaxID=6728 RepID=UPI0037431CF1